MMKQNMRKSFFLVSVWNPKSTRKKIDWKIKRKMEGKKIGGKYKRDLNLINYFYIFIQTHFICFSLLYNDQEI